MSSIAKKVQTNMGKKPHVVCVPYPAQGHINPMTKLAKLLHQRGFHVTFVNTEYNHRRLIKSRGLKALNDNPSFVFETIPDGLPPTDDIDATQDVPALSASTEKQCLEPFRKLLARLNDSSSGDGVVPPVSCVLSDSIMYFSIEAAEEIGVPCALLWTSSVSGFMGYLHYEYLIEKGLVPLKEESYVTNGFLNTVVEGIPAMKNIRLKDLPTFLRTTDSKDIMLNFAINAINAAPRGSAFVMNTFESLDKPFLDYLSSYLPRLLSVGPLHLIAEEANKKESLLPSVGSNLWKEENECLQWLDLMEKNSVLYINFGSVMVMTQEDLNELAWGLANSMKPFVWVIRADLVNGDPAVLPLDFLEETKGRRVLAGWCSQERVLSHPAVGGFMTHCGWNSTLESLAAGVPVICWPFFAEQQTNAWFLCRDWGVGLEIGDEVKREKVESLVRELIGGERGNEMREKALEWKSRAEEAISPQGSSFLDLDKLINEVLLQC